MKKLYIIKIGTTFPAIEKRLGDFDRWTANALDSVDVELGIVDAEHGDSLPKEEECAGVIITGSHAMVTDNVSWSVKLEKWIALLLKAQIPIFGICYGHQLLAHAMGGRAGFHPNGFEIGTVKVSKTRFANDDLLFCDLPASFEVQVNHTQSVLRLPHKAKILASNTFEPHQAFVL